MGIDVHSVKEMKMSRFKKKKPSHVSFKPPKSITNIDK